MSYFIYSFMFPSHVLEEVPQKGAILEQTYWNTKGNQYVPWLLLVSTGNHYLLVQEKEKTNTHWFYL